MQKITVLGILLAGLVIPVFAEKPAPKKAAAKKEVKAERTPSPEGAKVYIISPKDGATVKKNFTVVFGLKGMGIAPAGIDMEDTGHHHLLIDQKKLPPMDKKMEAEGIMHFGRGNTETELELKPGKHTLQLLLGDKNHVPHKPPVMSKKITITVK